MLEVLKIACGVALLAVCVWIIHGRWLDDGWDERHETESGRLPLDEPEHLYHLPDTYAAHHDGRIDEE